jgi:hypothetical protein
VLQAILNAPQNALPTKYLKPSQSTACDYHEHKTLTERGACEEQQAADGVFYVGFLRACLREVIRNEEEGEEEEEEDRMQES